MAYKGKYKVKNPEKYVGDPTKITYRSLWERQVMVYLDNSEVVVGWGSEEVVIPYKSPLDAKTNPDKTHRYFVDFYVKYHHNSGVTQECLIEVKPHKQTLEPKLPKRKTRRYYNELATYAVNQAKWRYAKRFCDERGWNFLIWTEHHLAKVISPHK